MYYILWSCWLGIFRVMSLLNTLSLQRSEHVGYGAEQRLSLLLERISFVGLRLGARY